MHISEFADKINCLFCGKIFGTKNWPIKGDWVPFYYQEGPGKYNLKVKCPHCDKEWYIAWDDNPGPIQPLGF